MTYRGLSVAALMSAITHGLAFLLLLPDNIVVKANKPATLSLVGFKADNASIKPDSFVQNSSPNLKPPTEELSRSFATAKNADSFVNYDSPNSLKKTQNITNEFKSPHAGSAGVEHIAAPSTAWVLNTDSISATQVVVLNLQLYIDADGKLDNYFVINSTAGEEQTQYILKDFLATMFTPAAMEGRTIASTIAVEIKIDNLDSSSDQNTEKR